MVAGVLNRIGPRSGLKKWAQSGLKVGSVLYNYHRALQGTIPLD